MPKFNLNDTIAAISTSVGEGGIGIVRLSGKDSLKIADSIFSCKSKAKPSTFKTYTTHYGWVKDGDRLIDEVILTVMKAPASYTKEDIVEINCHGGIVAMRAVLDLALEKGARLADPGEFTKRAFLNGRIDLTQAEAVLDVIRAKTDFALKIGQEQLKGGLSLRVNKIRHELLGVLSGLEASIDFPDEEIGSIDLKDAKDKLDNINKRLIDILEGSKKARIFREGIHVVICGKPNVGKSSLLNALLKRERSIVTPVAGTTRDTIEEVIDIKGIPVRIVDTAGILEPRDLIEREAIRRSKKQIDLADLAIIIFDGSKRLAKEDDLIIRKLKKKNTIAVVNKIDKRQLINKEKISKDFKRLIYISAKKQTNINLLEEAIAGLVYDGKVVSAEPLLVGNLRHINGLKAVQNFIAQGIKSLDNKLTIELVAQDLKEALSHLDLISGKSFSEDLLDKIFSDFCIGK